MSSEMNHDRGIGPAGYHRTHYASRDWRAYAPLLAEIVRQSAPGPILDVGSGCSHLVEAAAEWGLECVGLEGSIEAIEMARSRAPGLDVRHHRLSTRFPFAGESFQTAVMNQVLEHLEPQVAAHALGECHRVLRAGGLLLVASPSRFNRKELRLDPTHINLVTPWELRLQLTRAGFADVRPFDSPLPFLGSGRLGVRIMKLLFRLAPLDRLSATANATAFKRA